MQGIALILFGILLCLAEEEINRELFHSIGYFPFALIGAITGIAGLVMVFYEKKDEPESRQNAQKRKGRRFTSAIFQSSIVGMEILSVPWASNSAI